MPEITNENKELKEKKESVAKKSTKSNVEKATKKNVGSSAKKTTSTKKFTSKTTSDKTAKTKSTQTSSKNENTTKKAAPAKSSASSKKTVIEKKEVEKKKKATSKPKTDNKKLEDNSKKKVTKKVEEKPKKVASKKMEEKLETNKGKKVAKKTDKKKDEIIKEETVIQKIKSFIAKIVAMQEEARKEAEAKNEDEENVVNNKSKKRKKVVSQEKIPYMLEYYDLPYRYNETIVKILAQTPKRLFVYWDISDNDRQKYLKAFGETFFEETYPVLLVHNQEKEYTFEVPINDFANSWYLDINDSKSKYVIELGRKFKNKPEIVNIARTEETKDVVIHNDYIPITTSNVLEVPNDHILFEEVQVKALYRNVKDNTETFVDINNNEFIKTKKHIYNIYDIYKEIYKNENGIEEESLFDFLNPSSMSSSKFK